MIYKINSNSYVNVREIRAFDKTIDPFIVRIYWVDGTFSDYYVDSPSHTCEELAEFINHGGRFLG